MTSAFRASCESLPSRPTIPSWMYIDFSPFYDKFSASRRTLLTHSNDKCHRESFENASSGFTCSFNQIWLWDFVCIVECEGNTRETIIGKWLTSLDGIKDTPFSRVHSAPAVSQQLKSFDFSQFTGANQLLLAELLIVCSSSIPLLDLCVFTSPNPYCVKHSALINHL